jgi:hypothetical protein
MTDVAALAAPLLIILIHQMLQVHSVLSVHPSLRSVVCPKGSPRLAMHRERQGSGHPPRTVGIRIGPRAATRPDPRNPRLASGPPLRCSSSVPCRRHSSRGCTAAMFRSDAYKSPSSIGFNNDGVHRWTVFRGYATGRLEFQRLATAFLHFLRCDGIVNALCGRCHDWRCARKKANAQPEYRHSDHRRNRSL